ncbi:hypothetical protein Tco_1277447 [Tanacetum coccineum]
MAKDIIDIVTPMLTQKELDAFCSKYIIPTNLRPELPGHNKTIRNSTEGKIGIYTRFIEFVSFHIPLSKFLLSVLEYYQINFSQLSVIAAAKISHFEILCRVHKGQPTVEMGLLDFVKSTDPFKVKVGERTLGEGEILLSKETEDMVISPSRDIIRILDHTIVDELKSMAGKKKRRVVFNDGLPPVKKADVSLCVGSLVSRVPITKSER